MMGDCPRVTDDWLLEEWRMVSADPRRTSSLGSAGLLLKVKCISRNRVFELGRVVSAPAQRSDARRPSTISP